MVPELPASSVGAVNFRRLFLLTALLLTIGGMAPVTAAAEPVTVASCGTDASMWVGSFRGTRHFSAAPDGDDATLVVQISNSGAGLAVHTFVNGREDAQSGTTTIQNGNIRWVAWYYALPFAFYDTYGATGVTCAGGKVTAFSGLVSTTTKWVGPYAADDDPFTVTRTA